MKFKIVYGGFNSNWLDSDDESVQENEVESEQENEVGLLNSIFLKLKEHESNYENSYEKFSYFDFDYDFYINEYIYSLDDYKIVNNNDLLKLISKVKKLYDKLNVNVEYKKNSYIIKKLLPKESKIIYLGDYHSSVHSLMVVINYLQEKGILTNDYKLTDNYYIIFLGDIVDRGPYGIECLYIIYLLFYINNQEDYRVIILNGNHEEEDTYKRYGFSTEMDHQISTSREDLEELIEYLPLCLFIKNNDDSNSKWYQFCHGGIDKHHLNGEIKNFLNNNNNDKIVSLNYGEDEVIGFLWSDFADNNSTILGDESMIIDFESFRPTYSTTKVNEILNDLNIMTIISGHQDLTNYAFLLRNNNDNNNNNNDNIYELDDNYPDHGLFTFKNINENISLDVNDINDIQDVDKSNSDQSFFINSYKINMDTISASVMSSATISKEVPYSVYGILDLEKNESEIVYLKPNFGI